MPSKKRSWKELSPRARVRIVIAAAVQFALTAAALADLRRRDPVQVRGSRRVWAAVSFVNFVGPIAYFAFGIRRDGV
ncbi:PLDc N-terminal domain-containing protein [Aldersonia sp. NBC_00410]|uniref:PLDc N-terminal domain-containing protein n=1 Tax=Aldersonia sp. NBC_00410 TaxID=2975954 RepID=UPI0022546434|nr:PLDc N-terminal domain-containing protein [Aldersonia sp. NBC_00410]MCX5043820.1 PLDc N-terminal domain-containing protein [Aldersonia sp. NBC_00410]